MPAYPRGYGLYRGGEALVVPEVIVDVRGEAYPEPPGHALDGRLDAVTVMKSVLSGPRERGG